MEKKFFDNKEFNKVLYESERFIVIPSLGSLVKGWLLIVPKRFVINLSLLDASETTELLQLVSYVENKTLNSFGEFVLFEHGPANKLSKVGCGVDYAHLHMVPIKFDLIKGIEKFTSYRFNWQNLRTFTDLKSNRNNKFDYLYFRDQVGNSLFTEGSSLPSQLFRRIIASYINKPECFDWKNYPEISNINYTIEAMNSEKHFVNEFQF